MNLYQVTDKEHEWACFVFDITHNRAKARVAEHFGEDYVDMRYKTLKKGVNVPTPSIVDSEDDEAYQMVLACGYKYYSEQELGAMVQEWLNEPFRSDDNV